MPTQSRTAPSAAAGAAPRRYGRVMPDRDARLAAQPTHQQVVDATAETERVMIPQRVPVNVYEAGDALVVVAPIPAVTPDDVNIELRRDPDGARLRFWAHLRSAAPRDYLQHEWEYGGYEREVTLPTGFGAGVEASLANGQLAMRVLRGDVAPVVVHPATT